MANYLDLFVITTTTVGKIMLCCIIGMYISRSFSDRAKSEKGFSYISVHILLPCLLFSNLCLGVTWDSLERFYWAPLIALVPISAGFLFSLLIRIVLPKEYHALTTLACSFQNGLTFPLSLLLNLKGISWMTSDAVADAQSYIYLYNIICSTGLWAIGEPLIAYHKAKEVEEEERRAVRITSDDSAQLRGGGSLEFPSTSSTDAKAHLEWYRPASPCDQPISASNNHTASMEEGGGDGGGSGSAPPRNRGLLCNANRIGAIAARALQSPPVLFSLSAIAIALTPPLRWVAESFMGQMVLGGFSVVGTGMIPLQLLVLGCSITSTKPSDEEDNDDENNSNNNNNNNDELSPNSLAFKLQAFISPQNLFTVCAIILRMLILPTVTFTVIHLLRKAGVLPDEKPFLLAMFLEACSPSAINSSIICTMHNYHQQNYARMIFFMYITSIGSTAIWLFLYVLYLGDA